MSAIPENPAGSARVDADQQESREWMDALSAVIEAEGPERAHYLLEQLLEHARQSSIDMPFSANTGYVNTIEANQEERCPGNIEIEERLREGAIGTAHRVENGEMVGTCDRDQRSRRAGP